MAEYYYHNSSRREVKKRRNPLIVRIMDLVLIVATMAIFVAMLVTLLAPYMHPSTSWIFPIIGLFTPIIYIISLLLTLYWVVRWKWLIAAPMMLVVVLGLFQLPLYAKIESRNNIGDGLNLRGSVRLISYNIKSFTGEGGTTKKGAGVESYDQYLDSLNGDIICLQEFDKRIYQGSPLSALKGYNMFSDKNLAIFSRYPIVASSGNFAPHSNVGGGSIWIDVLVGRDTLRVFNSHLCSTTLSDSDSNFITSPAALLNSDSDERLYSIFKRVHSQSIGRAEQAEVIAQVIKESSKPTIVCGDFNDIPTSYTYRVISQGLQDSFSKVGTGYSNTFSGFMNTLRIDYILGSKDINFILFERDDDMRSSDHYPIITNFKIEER